MGDVIVSDNYYSEDVLLPLVKIVSHNVNVWKKGLYYVNYQVTDPSGNQSQVVMRHVMVNYPPNCDPNGSVSSVEDTKSQEVSIYPNPSQGMVMINFGDQYRGFSNIRVVSTTGKEVYRTRQFNQGSGLELNLGGLSSGSYVLCIRKEDGSESHHPVVLSK
jgi:hypothetical protein